jgi:ADP-heptose:LPS heptosyltransferase
LAFFYFKYINSSKITLIRDGGIGDTIMSTTTVVEFQKKYPETQVNIVADHPSFYKHFNLNLVRNSEFPAIWLTYGHYDFPFYAKRELHYKEIMARMLGLFNVKNIGYSIGEFDDQQFIMKYLSEKKYIVIQPNASAWFPEKNWSLKNWVNLVSSLTSMGLLVYQIGAIHEGHIEGAVDFRGKMIQQSMLVIKHATLLIGVNSFGEQAASAFGIRSVILYGPTNPKYSLNPNQIAVFNDNCIEYNELSQLNYQFSSLDKVRPEFVLEQVMKSLRKS